MIRFCARVQFYRGKAFERAMAKDREAKERVDAELAARKERLNRMKQYNGHVRDLFMPAAKPRRPPKPERKAPPKPKYARSYIADIFGRKDVPKRMPRLLGPHGRDSVGSSRNVADTRRGALHGDGSRLPDIRVSRGVGGNANAYSHRRQGGADEGRARPRTYAAPEHTHAPVAQTGSNSDPEPARLPNVGYARSISRRNPHRKPPPQRQQLREHLQPEHRSPRQPAVTRTRLVHAARDLEGTARGAVTKDEKVDLLTDAIRVKLAALEML